MMLLALAAAGKSPLKGFLGALHPGIVHFPIALLAVGALFEVVQILRGRKEPAPGTQMLALLAAAAAVPATLFGFMLADAEGSEGKLIDLHQWLGVSSTIVAVVAALFAIKAKNSPGCLTGLRIGLIVGSGLVLATGYVGGELVFGENHLFKAFKEEAKQPLPPTPPPLLKPETAVADKVDFAKDIAPIIKDMCFKCHGGEKVKGKFKLNTRKDAMDGGESGKEILPGKPTLSKFYTSLTLDKDNDELMPPVKEKARPTPEQIEKVKKWIEQGAEWPDGMEFKK
ncbi:MAG: hypothetical protein JO332_18500 [Planctomycetaceae bacterium]|nr:hypothetical protein [Planctomycetaceae bacterium]